MTHLNEIQVLRAIMHHLNEGGWEFATEVDAERSFIHMMNGTKIVLAAYASTISINVDDGEQQVVHKFMYSDSVENVVDTILAELFN